MGGTHLSTLAWAPSCGRAGEFSWAESFWRSALPILVFTALGSLNGLFWPDPVGDFPGEVSGRLCCLCAWYAVSASACLRRTTQL